MELRGAEALSDIRRFNQISREEGKKEKVGPQGVMGRVWGGEEKRQN